MSIEFWVGLGAACLATVLMSSCAFALLADAEIRELCLSHGYPQHVAYIGGGGYCIKRVDQTDVVVPIEKVTK